jgi:hypothetical protein
LIAEAILSSIFWVPIEFGTNPEPPIGEEISGSTNAAKVGEAKKLSGPLPFDR